MYTRSLNILKDNSFFLFGARGTGKSYLLKEHFEQKSILWIDLLNSAEFIRYSRNPGLLFEECQRAFRASREDRNWVVVDEVQRVPQLLNEVHRIIESKQSMLDIRFALTGSSARKLKRGGANLLAGRALVNHLFPLTVQELGDDFSLESVLNWGSLPLIVQQKNDLVKAEILDAYYGVYLREEIREEQVIRNIDPFTRFLEVAAQSSGQIVNYSSIGRDCQVDSKAVARYYQILDDTLIGFFLPPYHDSVRKQQVSSAKFYFFDLGVQRAIRGALDIPITRQSYGYGNAFEQFFILEVFRLNSYYRKRYKFYFLKTKDGVEVDLIVVKPTRETILIEIKSAEVAHDNHTRHLTRLLSDFQSCSGWVVSQDEKEWSYKNVQFLHWRSALARLFTSGSMED